MPNTYWALSSSYPHFTGCNSTIQRSDLGDGGGGLKDGHHALPIKIGPRICRLGALAFCPVRARIGISFGNQRSVVVAQGGISANISPCQSSGTGINGRHGRSGRPAMLRRRSNVHRIQVVKELLLEVCDRRCVRPPPHTDRARAGASRHPLPAQVCTEMSQQERWPGSGHIASAKAAAIGRQRVSARASHKRRPPNTDCDGPGQILRHSSVRRGSWQEPSSEMSSSQELAGVSYTISSAERLIIGIHFSQRH